MEIENQKDMKLNNYLSKNVNFHTPQPPRNMIEKPTRN